MPLLVRDPEPFGISGETRSGHGEAMVAGLGNQHDNYSQPASPETITPRIQRVASSVRP